MKRIVGFVMLCGLVVATTGCFDTTTMVSLRRDGSGYIVETTYLSAQAAAMMSGMMAGMEGDTGGANVTVSAGNGLMDEEKARAKASELGEGVTFASIKEVAKPDGSKGAQVIYAFTDVNKIKVTTGDGPDMGGGAEEKEKSPIRFSYTPGDLTIQIPESQPDDDTAAVEDAPAPGPQDEAMAAQMMQGMLPMFKGMRMHVVVRVEDEIKSTNAKYVTVGSKTGKKQYVTLLDFNIDRLLEAQGGMQKLMQLQETKDEAKAMEILASVTGIKVETQKKVNITF